MCSRDRRVDGRPRQNPSSLQRPTVGRFTGRETTLGRRLQVMGDKVVIGAPGSYSVTSGAYVFTKPSEGWDNPYIVSKLTAPEPRTVLLFRRIGFDER